MTQIDALNAAVDAEHAAIFTYGLATAFVSSAQRGAVGTYVAEHRTRRDDVAAKALAVGGTDRPSAAGYTLPFAVNDPTSAAKALALAESSCATAYRAVVEQATTPHIRQVGVDGLTDCALRGAYWRAAQGVSPVSVAFPGAGR